MYSGTWYESDPGRLHLQLEKFLRQPVLDTKSLQALKAKNPPLDHPILAIIAPHAGYIYSGAAAAHSYKALSGQSIKRVFLLGPSHHIPFHGAALPLAVSFQTPLGDLEVDQSVITTLRNYPNFVISPEVHKIEHSLELQLPFIKEALPDVKIVPIIVGKLADETEIRLMAQLLKSHIASSDLVIVSSDFTHFGPRYHYQPFTSDIRNRLRKLDFQAFSYLRNCNLPGFIQFQADTKDTICGFYPCSLLMALLPSTAHATLLEYYTSQDITRDDPDNSVSYMAIAFSGGSWTSNSGHHVALTKEEQRNLMQLARATLDSYVNHRPIPSPKTLGIHLTDAMQASHGAFVTLYKAGSSDKAGSSTVSTNTEGTSVRKNSQHNRVLRGCIGYIWPLKSLYQAIIDNTISACSHDPRFQPVEAGELKDIEIEISVLTPPRRVLSYKNISLGQDGIILYKDRHQSVFLPNVATEFGWSLEQTLTQLSLKAGLESDAWKSGADFDIFQAQAFEEPR